MNKYWTFANINDKDWVNETFYSKIDAILEGRKVSDDEVFVVRQLDKTGFKH